MRQVRWVLLLGQRRGLGRVAMVILVVVASTQAWNWALSVHLGV